MAPSGRAAVLVGGLPLAPNQAKPVQPAVMGLIIGLRLRPQNMIARLSASDASDVALTPKTVVVIAAAWLAQQRNHKDGQRSIFDYYIAAIRSAAPTSAKLDHPAKAWHLQCPTLPTGQAGQAANTASSQPEQLRVDAAPAVGFTKLGLLVEALYGDRNDLATRTFVACRINGRLEAVPVALLRVSVGTS